MLQTMLYSVLIKAFNRFLRLDVTAARNLANLEGRRVAIEVTELGIRLMVTVVVDAGGTAGFQLLSGNTEPVDTTITASSLGFLRLACQMGDGEADFSALKVHGDLELGSELQRIIQSFSVDWEAHLASIIGDLPAHTLMQQARQLYGFYNESRSSVRQTMTDYLQEESRLMPTRLEVEDFFADVATVQDDVARLAVRVARLQHRREEEG